MKHILITGKGSYIGTYLKKTLENYPEEYRVDELNMLDEDWIQHDFTKYDVVYHVAGIAHIKEKPENEELYFKVNRDLAIETAKKAKASGVKQFIFMSSMSVYGLEYSDDYITKETECHPTTYYGKSKLQAEQILSSLETVDFKICILRPPMVYGKDSPGNLTKLFKAVRKFHVFPKIKNQRSSITINKLCKHIKFYIDNECQGIYIPQNNEYMCTYETVKKQMEYENTKVLYITLCNPIIHLLIGKIGIITKCFGDLKYEK